MSCEMHVKFGYCVLYTPAERWCENRLCARGPRARHGSCRSW